VVLVLQVIYIEGQGHVWPGSRRVLPVSMVGPSTDRLDATDAIWDFFRTVADPSRDAARE
jgi:poly(3-hydroxybutyrate) depolymerase